MESAKEHQGRILLVDDESAILRTFRYCLEDEGYTVATANSAAQADALLQRQVFDLCFLDLRLGEDNGLDVLAQMRIQAPWMRVVIVTAHSAVDTAVDAIQAGAADYLVKPCSPDQLRLATAKQLEVRQLSARLEALEGEIRKPKDGLDSHSPAMMAVLETARQVAGTDANILILGESGTGKGELAQAIHGWSKRAKKSCVTINCPSLTAELMESELFGHTRGAFTGASESTLGRVNQADGGTLFLDEIGDFPLTLQPKLLRFIQDKAYERVGDPVTRRADVRILAATNLNLEDMVREGRFREDLLYRLNVITLHLPPLRERSEDILTLADRFLARFVKEYARPARGFSEEARLALANYRWPGNIRELRNVVERASIICPQEVVEISHLGMAEQTTPNTPRIGSALSLDQLEKAHIGAVLATSETLDQAAKTLGIDASTLYRSASSTTCEPYTMKLAIKLRTRLFLSISALITVALLGLLLGVVSVMQMAQTQEALIRNNFITLDLGLKLRQSLGDQLILMLSTRQDPKALQASINEYQHLLDEGIEHERKNNLHNGFVQARSDYESFLKALNSTHDNTPDLSTDNELRNRFNLLRNGLIAEHRQALDNIYAAQASARDRALIIAWLLGLVGLAVLTIGFITAHGIARRFGAPIEALAKAADNIGKGNFEVVLPLSSATEMNLLTRRFGIMAEALRQHQATNVDELLAGQQRLQAVLDSIDDGLLMIDQQGRLEHLNPVAQRQLGWDESRLSQPLGEALMRPELDQQLLTVLRGGSLERAPEDLSVDIEGENRLLTYSLTPVSQPKGPILGAVMVLHDVTEQRAFERVRSEFVLRASHELRTPVTGMHMAFGLFLERAKFDPQSRETDLLNFSRYQNGLQKLTLGTCDVTDLLEHARARFAELANAQHIELLVEAQPELPRLYADQVQLERVLDNLLGNALRHTAEGGQIRLQARRHGERVIISVEDNGEGIAYGQQGRIFEPFVQVGRKKGGAGLGLALCKEIVQLHGGRMGVYSRPGQGTQFYMALPL